MAYDPVPVPHETGGHLAGLTFAVKDLYDVAGYRSGWGSPTRLEEAPVASRSAPIVESCLVAGARFMGKTITDEFAFSLNGQNAHYGTPINVRAPGRIPGGSSSGSAAAVAAGLVDFAIGTDTGGSVRAPASYCGLYGLRPTHGRLPLEGCMPLAPLYDTAGWFARDIAVYSRVADVLLGADAADVEFTRLYYPEDLWGLLDPSVLQAFEPALRFTAQKFRSPEPIRLIEPVCDIGMLFRAFRHTQGHEIWSVHGDWMMRRKPDLGPGVKERFAFASEVTDAQNAEADGLRARFRDHINETLGADAVLVLPTVLDVAPLTAMPIRALEAFRNKALTLLCVSGMSGVPQISLPLVEKDGLPIGLSLIAPAGLDRALVSLAARVCGVP